MADDRDPGGINYYFTHIDGEHAMVLGTLTRDLRDSAHAQVDIDLSILSAIGDTTG